MKKTVKLLLILLLVLAMVAALAACQPDDDGGVGTPGDSGALPMAPTTDSARIFEDLAEGLRLMGEQADGVKHVTSNFTLRVSRVNVTVDYVANYNDDREEDSQYLLRVYNNNDHQTVTFLYYTSNNLYYQINGKYREVTGFSGAAQFDTFVGIMRAFDVGSLLSSESVVENFSALGAFVEGGITRHVATEGVVTVTAREINLDEFKPEVNEFFRDNIGHYGTRLDALTQMLLGFKLSDLKEVEVGQLTVEELKVIRTDDAVNDFRMKFYGKQSNNVADYLLDINYAVSGEYGDVTPAANDSLSNNDYISSPSGNYHYTGKLEVPSLDATFDLNLRAVIDRADNSRNNIILEILNREGQNLDPANPYYHRTEVVMAYYQEEMLYLDLSGLMSDYIRDGVRLKQMNFPRARIEGINLSQEMDTLSTYLTEFLQMGYDGNIWDVISDEESAINQLLSKVETDGTKIIVTVDKEALNAVLGDYSGEIVDWLSSRLGISKEVIESALGDGTLDTISFKFIFDTATEQIVIETYLSGELLFRLTMAAQEIPESGVDMTLPESFDYTQYLAFRTPEAINLHLEGTLQLQGAETADFSRFFGAMIGDVTGVNSPFTFRIGDELTFSLDIWQESYINVGGSVYLNGALILELYAASTNPEEYLINNVMQGVKYRIPRAGLNEAFTDLLGETSIFNTDSVMDVLRRVAGNVTMRFGDDSIDFWLAKDEGSGIDPIYELIGIGNLTADMHAQIFFTRPDLTVNDRDYVLPQIAELPDLVFESMYEANWHESVDVTFRDSQNNGTVKTYLLTFEGESATLQSNRYYYQPIAKLFGQQVSYQMTLTDTVNGTKVVDTLVTREEYVNDDGVVSQRWVDLMRLSLDPSLDSPFPDVLYVQYDDGTIGSLPYEIPDFPYNRENVKNRLIGLAPAPYTVYIGRGSIAERTFVIDVEILNRTVQVADEDYYGDVPIIASITIDPYDYALRRRSDPDYTPIPDTVEIDFGSNLDPDSVVRETVYGFEWELDSRFNLDTIHYLGGVYHVYGHYNRLRVALRVTVLGKVVDYIQMSGEQRGQYTIDSLMSSTFTIPTISTADREIRVYFQTGHYRIIGAEPAGYDHENRDDPMCDGYFPLALSWDISRATGVYGIDLIPSPLVRGGERTNLDTALFGLDSVGLQDLTLTVLCPGRRVQETAATRFVITAFVTDGIDGEILPNTDPISSSEKISMVSLSANGNPGEDEFVFDPYEKDSAKRRLPSYIYMDVEVGGQTVRRAYPVTWESSTIIDGNGNIRHPQADECYMLAVGVIGDNKPQEIRVVIHNLSGRYVGVEMTNPATGALIAEDMGEYTLEVNQYEAFRLPTEFTLLFSEASGIAPERYDSNWVYTDQTTGYTYRYVDGQWYRFTAAGQSSTPSYPFSWTGGRYTITSTVEANNDLGVLEQTVSLTLVMARREVLGDRVTGLWSTMDNDGTMRTDNVTQLRYVEIDGYSDESGRLLELLEDALLGNAITVGAVFPAQNNNVSQVPMVFDVRTGVTNGLAGFIALLTSPLGTSGEPNDLYTLRGYLNATRDLNGEVVTTPLTQEVELNFRIKARELSAVGFDNLLESYISGGLVGFEANLNSPNSTLVITISKPYAVEGIYTTESGAEAYGPLLPRQYIEYLFSKISLTFGGEDPASTGISLDEAIAVFEARADVRTSFNDYVLPNNLMANINDTRMATLTLQRLSNGATIDPFTVYIEVRQDTFVQFSNSTTILVDTYNENGTEKFGNHWYDVSDRVQVEYQLSGVVSYSGLDWYAVGDYAAIYGEGRIRAGDLVTQITSNFFGTMVGNSIDLMTTLPTGREYHLNINFLPKNINGTAYDADADDTNYSITNGTIVIDNVYEIYPFDPNKLPRIITPRISSRYTLSGDVDEHGNPIVISFTVERWIPSAAFSDGAGNFDQAKLNAAINSGGLSEPMELATADIRIYEGTQTVRLMIQVRSLNEIQVSHDTLEFIDNHLDLDPYRDNYGGNFTLPKDITVTFTDLSGVRITHRFTEADDVRYFAILGDPQTGERVPLSAIPYNHLGHLLGAEYGEPSDIITLELTLPDGKMGYVYVRFLSRELDEVLFPNHATKLGDNGQLANGEMDRTYYIDPYDARTFTVPATVRLTFKGTSDTFEMTLDWSLNDAGAPFVRTAEGWRFVPSMQGYAGGVYTFSGALSGFGVDDQAFHDVRVIVLNRSLISNDLGSYDIPNPISYLVSDLSGDLNPLTFYDLASDPLYDAYLAIASPVVPEVAWALTNDDIHYNGFTRNITGVLSYGDVTGEGVIAVITAPKVTFDVLVTGSDRNSAERSNIINFNPITRASVDSIFYVRVTINGEQQIMVFTSETAIDADNPPRLLIRWGARDTDTTLMTFTLGNYYKSENVVLRVTRASGYRYNYQQIVVTGIDFGYGMAGNGTVSLAIDPLNPVVPTQVHAQGTVANAGGVVETLDLGMVDIVWDSSIYQMPMGGGEKNVRCELHTADGSIVYYTVIVGYLNRTPVGFYTSERGFSEAESQNQYYPLSILVGGQREWYFRVDPLNGDVETGKVDLPTSIRITFAGADSYQQEYLRQAVSVLGDALIFGDIEWSNTDGLIRMEGTPEGQPLILQMLSFTLRVGLDDEPTERISGNVLNSEFRLHLKVLGKSVLSTDVSTRKVRLDGSHYQLAGDEYAIDPYSLDYLDTLFPATIRVTFEGEQIPRVFENLVWTYDEEYLRRPEVISGLLLQSNPDAMQLSASFRVYGVDMEIIFPIKVRDIVTDINAQGGTSPLYGGKLYVIQGIPMLQQLPRYLYYKFILSSGDHAGDLDVTQVPIMWVRDFDDAALIQSFNNTYLTNTSGVNYHIQTTLGWVDQGNIVFDVEVINPVLYQVRQSTNEFGFISYSNGSSYYSEIVVARDYNGYYIEGRETVVLPNRVIVNADGDYLEVQRIDYNIAGGYATVTCRYVFQTADADPNLSGNDVGTDEDSAKLTITFTVPIVTYDYTAVAMDYEFLEEDAVYVVNAPGMLIDVADLPLAYDADGNSLKLLWDLSAVDTRRAGTYTASAWYRNQYGESRLLTLTIVVLPFRFSEADVTISRDWLNRVYDGNEHDILQALTLADFLRETGVEGQVQHYRIEYSIDGEYDADGNFAGTWQSIQPVQVRVSDSGAVLPYYVRITVEDYNVTGYVILAFTISKQVIDSDAVGLQNSADDASLNLTYEFDGTEHTPYVYGLPRGATYNLTFNLLSLDEDGNIVTDPRSGDYIIADGNANVRPYNAGIYQVILSFPDQRNFDVRVTSYSRLLTITKANVNYTVISTMVYNGEYRDVMIDGLPDDLGDIRIVYTYYDANNNPLPVGTRIRNVGDYYVTVSIYGGTNYPDAINDAGSTYSALYHVPVRITPKQVILRVGHVESEYLEALNPLNSGVYFVDASDPMQSGLVGTDTMAIFGEIEVYWTGRSLSGRYNTAGGTLTANHMVDTYYLSVRGDVTHANYTVVSYEDGEYVITANAENVVVIQNREELNTRLNLLQDGDTVRWYLMPGDYGSITLNRNASVSIVGSYNIGTATQEIAVTFQTINIQRGAVLIDIVRMRAISGASLVTIGANADSVTINRSEFVMAGTSVLNNSVAVSAAQNYKNTLYMENTSVTGYTRAINMAGGSVNLRGCTFSDNYSGVYVENGNVTLENNRFEYTKGDALYIAGSAAATRDISIVNNVFEGNLTAIRTVVELVSELDLLNTFIKNATDVVLLD